MRSLASIIIALSFAITLAFGSDTRADDAPLKAFFQPNCPSEIPPAEHAAAGPLGLLILEPLLRPLISTALDEEAYGVRLTYLDIPANPSPYIL